MKKLLPYVTLVFLFLSSCSSEQDQTQNEIKNVRAVVEDWVQYFGGADKQRFLKLFKTFKPIPELFLSPPGDMSITFNLDGIRIEKELEGNYSVELPYAIRAVDTDGYSSVQKFTLAETSDGEYKIVMFTSDLATSILHILDRKKQTVEIQLRYDSLFANVETIARTLSLRYDSVIFTTMVNGVELFYVTNGEWNYPYTYPTVKPYTAKIGVVDKNGNVIVPVKYDKVYNPNGTIPGFIEVEADGKKGLYRLDGQAFLEAQYDAIFPVTDQNSGILCIVRLTEKFGMISKDGSISFEVELNAQKIAEQIIPTLKFDYPGKISLLQYPFSPDEYYRKEPSVEPLTKVIITPNYLLQLGLINEEYYDDILIEDEHMGTFTMGVSVEETSLVDNVLSVFSKFYAAGIDARDFSFERTDVVTLDENLLPIKQVEGILMNSRGYGPCDQSAFRKVDTDLYEIQRAEYGADLPYDMMKRFFYFTIEANGDIRHLNTHRIFGFTKFVKIDLSYFKTCALRNIDFSLSPRKHYNYNLLAYGELSYDDLDIMRNEIFAEYGYRFKSEKWRKYFSSKKWYKPALDNVDHLLTEIDKHNLEVIIQYQKSIEGKKFVADSIMYVAAG